MKTMAETIAPIALIFSTLILISISHAARPTPSPSTLKAVNLGGWLVTEGWIKPSLFDAIPNNDLLDGTQVQFKSVAQGMYLSAESGGGTIIVANRTSASGWETFKLWRITETKFQFRVFNGEFIGVGSEGSDLAMAVSNTPGVSETFEIVRNSSDSGRVRIRAPNGLFLQARTEVSVTADYSENTNWGDDDPSVFSMSLATAMRGEFQITNGYGTDKATPVLQEHWRSFIVEDDFEFVAQSGLGGVRIPVGWWIASDPTPPWPFVGGSLQALDNAFDWAEKYNLKVIIDLHAAPGSQNGYEHSASRDGSIEWGSTQENIDQTVSVIQFLASRYAQREGLYAIELINEPRGPDVTLESLEKYYTAGYNAVRKYTTEAYVIMSTRLSADEKELLQFASGFQGSVLDIHYYNLYSDVFDNLSPQQNIDFVHNNRSTQLNSLTISNGPLVLIGEWVAEWQVNGATKEEYQRFANAQLEVYNRATFGWAYWTLKNVQQRWSLEWMIKNGYISLM